MDNKPIEESTADLSAIASDVAGIGALLDCVADKLRHRNMATLKTYDVTLGIDLIAQLCEQRSAAIQDRVDEIQDTAKTGDPSFFFVRFQDENAATVID